MEATRLSDDERDRLADFLNRLHALLERLLNRRRPLVADKDLELLRRAWAELEAQERFTTVRTLIQAGEYDFSLANHGLRGDQLRLKVGLFERAADELERKGGQDTRRS